eukprot:450173-Pelagomonas_calceolata.AAC.1
MGHVPATPLHAWGVLHYQGAHNLHPRSLKSVTSVAFLPGTHVLASAGGGNMQIKFWDLRMPCMPTFTAQPDPASTSSRAAGQELGRKGRGRQVCGLSKSTLPGQLERACLCGMVELRHCTDVLTICLVARKCVCVLCAPSMLMLHPADKGAIQSSFNQVILHSSSMFHDENKRPSNPIYLMLICTARWYVATFLKARQGGELLPYEIGAGTGVADVGVVSLNVSKSGER